MKTKLAFQLFITLLFVAMTMVHCSKKEKSVTLFELKDNAASGIIFSNDLSDTPDFNIYKYRNYYNGGGVAIGDINNDGLPDIYMVANQISNKLFLNKGNWVFEDITERAGVGGERAWSTGVTMADINGDGFLDIYVCNSGDVKGDNKENELFINNGNGTFTEAAAEYGLNDPGFSTHASFFDYDKDGDLDVYILNNSFQAIGSFNLRKNERPIRDAFGGDKLYRNDNGKFVDVSSEAGIYGSVIGFGLGISVGDVNNDGWEDIYISNDFFERDYLYINQQDGTFKEDLVNQIMATSAASMGADIADINNDGFNDIFVTDMLPSEYERLKTVTTFENWDKYMYNVNNGYYHQFIRNTLQLNNRNGTFSEISRFAGVEASDWSWGALFFDMDNDGYKDLFIANGIYRDLTDQDYLQYIANESVMATIIKDEGVDYTKLIDIIPSRPVENHAYKNEGQALFSHFVNSGLLTPGFSNGSAYGDLDNDGDLDLVVNNVNMPCFIYENKAVQISGNNYIKINLIGALKNTSAIGARVEVTGESGQTRYYDCQPARGFQSAMDPRMNIGVGADRTLQIVVKWPSGKQTRLENVNANQMLILKEEDAAGAVKDYNGIIKGAHFEDVSHLLDYVHTENNYVDFNRERLNYNMLSTQGPGIGYGDINGDGLTDLIIPGPKGMATIIYIRQKDGSYLKGPANPEFEALKEAEHIRCHLFDADNDGDPDLYITSGGVELSEYSEYLFDMLFINDGKGNFTSSGQKLPISEQRISSSVVISADIDNDGDMDLFVGERVKIGQYGAPCSGYLLINDGKGNFTDETIKRVSVLRDIGMITDAVFADINGDGLQDLVISGECMPVTVLFNDGGMFKRSKTDIAPSGFWNTIKAADLNNDGHTDLVVGNLGLNSRFRASEKHPMYLYFNDFDQNGTPEAILCNKHSDGKIYPYALRHNLATQLPGLKKKFPDFASFKNACMEDIFGSVLLESSIVHKATELKTMVLINDGKGAFSSLTIPHTVQYSPVYAIAIHDINGDGFKDIFLGGNLYGVQPETGRYDASYGTLLLNDTKGKFSDQSVEWGFSIKGEIRDIYPEDKRIFIFRNNDSVKGLQLNQ